jgi:hypothetical protein
MKNYSQIIRSLSIVCCSYIVITLFIGCTMLEPTQTAAQPNTSNPTENTPKDPKPTSIQPAHAVQVEATQLLPTATHYDDPALGFAVTHPSDWDVVVSSACRPAYGILGQVQFTSNLAPNAEHPDKKYQITIIVSEAQGRTLTETVELALSTSKRFVPGRFEYQCCRTIGGKLAAEITISPGEILTLPSPTPPGTPHIDAGGYRTIIIHDARTYTLSFEPNPFDKSADSMVREAFEAFLHSFSFMPITESPVCEPPTLITLQPTPTQQ